MNIADLFVTFTREAAEANWPGLEPIPSLAWDGDWVSDYDPDERALDPPDGWEYLYWVDEML